MTAREGAECPDREADDEEEGDPARRAVGELDERLRLRGGRHDLAVAQRPVGAAAVARLRRAHERAPQDDDERQHRHAPGVGREAGMSVHFSL